MYNEHFLTINDDIFRVKKSHISLRSVFLTPCRTSKPVYLSVGFYTNKFLKPLFYIHISFLDGDLNLENFLSVTVEDFDVSIQLIQLNDHKVLKIPIIL